MTYTVVYLQMYFLPFLFISFKTCLIVLHIHCIQSCLSSLTIHFYVFKLLVFYVKLKLMVWKVLWTYGVLFLTCLLYFNNFFQGRIPWKWSCWSTYHQKRIFSSHARGEATVFCIYWESYFIDTLHLIIHATYQGMRRHWIKSLILLCNQCIILRAQADFILKPVSELIWYWNSWLKLLKFL